MSLADDLLAALTPQSYTCTKCGVTKDKSQFYFRTKDHPNYTGERHGKTMCKGAVEFPCKSCKSIRRKVYDATIRNKRRAPKVTRQRKDALRV